jgi:methyl-accepting chemotaxis protein
MVRLRSIKAKLQSWVVVIFVLTGTAGWAGIWGLLYISRTTKDISNEQVKRAEVAAAIEADIAAARRIDRDFWLAVAVSDPGKQKAEAAKLTAAWAGVGEHIRQVGDSTGKGAFAGPTSAHIQVAGAWGAVEAAVGKPFAELQNTVYADYERRVGDLEKQVRAISDASFGGVKVGTDKLYDWIWVLQVALFLTVAVCQGFSAWAGWQLSRTLTGELNALRESAEKISMGDLKTEVKVATEDAEIVAVGEALDRLRVSLGKAMDRLATRRGATSAGTARAGEG